MAYKEAELALNASTDPISLTGVIDIYVDGLLTGAVQVQIKYDSQILSGWYDWPGTGGLISADGMTQIVIGEAGNSLRLTGVANTVDVYVRIGASF